MLLRDETALVTGGSRGIGRSVALALAAEGTHLVLVSRSAATLEETAAACRKHGVRVEVMPQDLRDKAALPGLVERAATALGGLSFLINCATSSAHSDNPSPASVAAWEETLSVNLQAPIHLARLALPHLLRAKRPVIVNIGALMAHFGVATSAGYCASKHGLAGFSAAIFEDVRTQGVQVCSVLPGYIPPSPEREDGKGLLPEDVAEAVIFALTRGPRACCAEIVMRNMSNVPGG